MSDLEESCDKWKVILAVTDAIGRRVCGIYRFTCKKTGRVYVGQSKDVAERVKQHARDASKLHAASTAWHKALAESGGISAFNIEVLEVLPRDRVILAERENYWLSLHEAGTSILCFNTQPRSGLSPLNTTPPKVIYSRISAALSGTKRSKETRERISAAKLTPEGRARNSAANKGRKFSPQTIEKFRQAQLRPEILEKNRARLVGIPLKPEHVAKLKAFQNSPEQRAKTSARMKGRSPTDEQRERIRAALTGVPHTNERRRNMSVSKKIFLSSNPSPWKGRKHSHQSRIKMRASRLAYFARISTPINSLSPQ